MTDLESRVASLEHNVVALANAVRDIAMTQTLFASAAVAHLTVIAEQVRRLKDDFGGGWQSDDSSDFL